MKRNFKKCIAVVSAALLFLPVMTWQIHSDVSAVSFAETETVPPIDDDPEKFKHMPVYGPDSPPFVSAAVYVPEGTQDPIEPQSADSHPVSYADTEVLTEETSDMEETMETTTEPTEEYETLVHNERYESDHFMYHGVDVSKYQYNIDWQAVADDGIDYAIVRVGFRGYGESGVLAMDTMYETNIKGAIEAGLDVGVYFFTQALNEREAVEEAQYVLKQLEGYELRMPVYIDIENVEGAVGRMDSAELSSEELTAICDAFCSTIEQAGYRAGVYANKYWLTELLDAEYLSSNYEIWLANYTTETTYEGEYEAWQYTCKGNVEGIEVLVDRDVYYSRALEYPQPAMSIKDLRPFMPEFHGGGNITFVSSDPGVAMVTRKGFIYPVGKGVTTISAASDNGTFASMELSVDPHIIIDTYSIYFEEIGDTQQLQVLFSNSAIIWSTSDPDVAVVDKNGRIEAVGSGIAHIIATDQEGYSTMCTVTIPEEEFICGDCNMDGLINALDAAEILVYSANLGAGMGLELDETMTTVYDYNEDEIINSLDAAGILIDSAQAAVGS
ncbi:MAG: Ig-like domain-containing protein [Oscillospiraceae bacterium]|nr:Ig-like domain-containing protein [Oscillospiraceae bacterium]